MWTYENTMDNFYDGDGHALKSIESSARIEPSSPTTTDNPRYQLWSSVLGGAVTEITYTGSKVATKVYAGGAVIAEQIGNPGYSSKVEFLHADPVTGSTTRTNMAGEDQLDRKEYEPLGQEVQPDEPPVDPVDVGPTYNTADEPEWLCESYARNGNANGNGAKFFEMPVGCQIAALENKNLKDLFYKETSTQLIIIKNSPIKSYALPHQTSPSDKTLAYNKKATYKSKESLELITKTNEKIDGGQVGYVEINDIWDRDKLSAEFDEDFAERKLTDSEVSRLRNNVELLLRNESCAHFVENLLNTASKLFPKIKMSSDYILGVFDTVSQQNGFSLGNTVLRDYKFSGSTIRGSLKDGTAEVELDTGFQKVDIYKQTKGSFATSRNTEVMNLQRSILAARTTIHELMHVAGFGDYELAFAHATIKKDNEYLTGGKIHIREASDYWNKELSRACWVDANKLVK